MLANATPVIHVIDDDASFRTAVARLLSASGYTTIQHESASHFLSTFDPVRTGCILLDVNMPGVSGLELQEQLHAMRCILPVVFLTGHGDIPMSVRAIKTGAEDFLSKPVSKPDLLRAIDGAMRRCEQARAQEASLARARQCLQSLTPRELQVFGLLVQGKTNKEVARELGNTERTVKAQRSSILEKTGARSIADLTLLAVQLDLLDRAG
jgi:FixJ family two-component response regulator